MTKLNESNPMKHLLQLFLLQSFIDTAVNKHCLSGNVRGALGSQPDDGVGNFPWLSQPSQWRVRRPAIEDVFFRSARSSRPAPGQFLEPVGCGVTWANIVDQNSVFSEFIGQTLHQP